MDEQLRQIMINARKWYLLTDNDVTVLPAADAAMVPPAAKGWYDHSGNTVGIVPSRLKDGNIVERAGIEILRWSVIGRGLSGIFSAPDYERFINLVYDNAKPWLRESAMEALDISPDTVMTDTLKRVIVEHIATATALGVTAGKLRESASSGRGLGPWGFVMSQICAVSPDLAPTLGIRRESLSLLLASAMTRHATSQNEHARSIRTLPAETVRTLSEKAIKQASRDQAMTGASRVVVELGMPSYELLRSNPAIRRAPLVLDIARHVLSSGKQDRHPFDLRDLHGLYDAMQQPLATFYSRTKDKTAVVLTSLKNTDRGEGKERHYIVPVQFGIYPGHETRNNLDSIYPKDDLHVLYWMERGLLSYASPHFSEEFLYPAFRRIAADAGIGADVVEDLIKELGPHAATGDQFPGGIRPGLTDEQQELLGLMETVAKIANITETRDIPAETLGDDLEFFRIGEQAAGRDVIGRLDRMLARTPDGTLHERIARRKGEEVADAVAAMATTPLFTGTASEIADALEESGCENGTVEALRRAVAAGLPVNGIAFGGCVYINTESIRSYDQLRRTYLHERQHLLTTGATLAALAALTQDQAQQILGRLTPEAAYYSHRTREEILSEAVSYAMEVAYDTPQGGVGDALRALGIDNDIFIKHIEETDNEQRRSYDLSKARYDSLLSTAYLRGSDAVRPDDESERGLERQRARADLPDQGRAVELLATVSHLQKSPLITYPAPHELVLAAAPGGLDLRMTHNTEDVVGRWYDKWYAAQRCAVLHSDVGLASLMRETGTSYSYAEQQIRYSDMVRTEGREAADTMWHNVLKTSFMTYISSLEGTTLQLAAARWYCSGAVRLPEDIDKVGQAVTVARNHRVDVMKYSSPMEVMDAFPAAQLNAKDRPVDPDTVPTLHRARTFENGLVIYDIDNTEQSRRNLREIINTHFGRACSPWCLLQGDGEGNLTQASATYWNHYSAYPKQVAFINGHLTAFCANAEDRRLWWDRLDKPHQDAVPVLNGKDFVAYGETSGRIVERRDHSDLGEDAPDGLRYRTMLTRLSQTDGRIVHSEELLCADGFDNYSSYRQKVEDYYRSGRIKHRQESLCHHRPDPDVYSESSHYDNDRSQVRWERTADAPTFNKAFTYPWERRRTQFYADGQPVQQVRETGRREAMEILRRDFGYSRSEAGAVLGSIDGHTAVAAVHYESPGRRSDNIDQTRWMVNEIRYADGSLKGIEILNRDLFERGPHDAKAFAAVSFHRNGQMSVRSTHAFDPSTYSTPAVGDYRSWHSNGQLSVSCHFEEKMTPDKKRMALSGHYASYYEDGTLKKEADYGVAPAYPSKRELREFEAGVSVVNWPNGVHKRTSVHADDGTLISRHDYDSAGTLVASTERQSDRTYTRRVYWPAVPGEEPVLRTYAENATFGQYLDTKTNKSATKLMFTGERRDYDPAGNLVSLRRHDATGNAMRTDGSGRIRYIRAFTDPNVGYAFTQASYAQDGTMRTLAGHDADAAYQASLSGGRITKITSGSFEANGRFILQKYSYHKVYTPLGNGEWRAISYDRTHAVTGDETLTRDGLPKGCRELISAESASPEEIFGAAALLEPAREEARREKVKRLIPAPAAADPYPVAADYDVDLPFRLEEGAAGDMAMTPEMVRSWWKSLDGAARGALTGALALPQDWDGDMDTLPLESVEKIYGLLDGSIDSRTITINDNTMDNSIKFTESASQAYNVRTRENAEAADLTIAFAYNFNTAGERATRSSAGDRYVAVDFNPTTVGREEAVAASLAAQIRSMNPGTDGISLNIAGNGMQTLHSAGFTQQQADEFVLKVLRSLRDNEGVNITSIRSGGQTGIDEAGAKAGVALGIDTEVHAPKGFRFRDADGNDISSKEAFMQRFDGIAENMALRQPQAGNGFDRLHFYDGEIIPEDGVVFVFGSNPEGRHGKGAAKVAAESFGAVYGQGEGLQGNSYALPTKDLRVKENNALRSIPEKDIVASIAKMYECARQNPGRQFKVAYTNAPDEVTLNGYSGREMAAMFLAAGTVPENVQFSAAWMSEMERQMSEGVAPAAPAPVHEAEGEHWARYSDNGFEVSSRPGILGDSRFSALNARFDAGTMLGGHDISGMSIEDVYQKICKRSGKGQAPAPDSIAYNADLGTPREREDYSYENAYLPLWTMWADQHPQLVAELRHRSEGRVLTDRFASTRVSQARALSEIIRGVRVRWTDDEIEQFFRAPLRQQAEAVKSVHLEGYDVLTLGMGTRTEEQFLSMIPDDIGLVIDTRASNRRPKGTATSHFDHRNIYGKMEQDGRRVLWMPNLSGVEYRVDARGTRRRSDAEVDYGKHALTAEFSAAFNTLTDLVNEQRAAGKKVLLLGSVGDAKRSSVMRLVGQELERRTDIRVAHVDSSNGQTRLQSQEEAVRAALGTRTAIHNGDYRNVRFTSGHEHHTDGGATLVHRSVTQPVEERLIKGNWNGFTPVEFVEGVDEKLRGRSRFYGSEQDVAAMSDVTVIFSAGDRHVNESVKAVGPRGIRVRLPEGEDGRISSVSLHDPEKIAEAARRINSQMGWRLLRASENPYSGVDLDNVKLGVLGSHMAAIGNRASELGIDMLTGEDQRVLSMDGIRLDQPRDATQEDINDYITAVMRKVQEIAVVAEGDDVDESRPFHIGTIISNGQTGAAEAATVAAQMMGLKAVVRPTQDWCMTLNNDNIDGVDCPDEAAFKNRFHMGYHNDITLSNLQEQITFRENAAERRDDGLQTGYIPDRWMLALDDLGFSNTDLVTMQEVASANNEVLVTPQDMLTFIENCAGYGVTAPEAIDLEAVEHALEETRRMREEWKASGISFITLNSPEYPENLKRFKEYTRTEWHTVSREREDGNIEEYKVPSEVVVRRPAIIWYKGDVSLLQQPGVSVVTSTSSDIRTSEDDIRSIKYLGGALAENDLPMVASLTEGVNEIGLQETVDRGGKAVAVTDNALTGSGERTAEEIQAEMDEVAQQIRDLGGSPYSTEEGRALLSRNDALAHELNSLDVNSHQYEATVDRIVSKGGLVASTKRPGSRGNRQAGDHHYVESVCQGLGYATCAVGDATQGISPINGVSTVANSLYAVFSIGETGAKLTRRAADAVKERMAGGYEVPQPQPQETPQEKERRERQLKLDGTNFDRLKDSVSEAYANDYDITPEEVEEQEKEQEVRLTPTETVIETVTHRYQTYAFVDSRDVAIKEAIRARYGDAITVLPRERRGEMMDRLYHDAFDFEGERVDAFTAYDGVAPLRREPVEGHLYWFDDKIHTLLEVPNGAMGLLPIEERRANMKMFEAFRASCRQLQDEWNAALGLPQGVQYRMTTADYLVVTPNSVEIRRGDETRASVELTPDGTIRARNFSIAADDLMEYHETKTWKVFEKNSVAREQSDMDALLEAMRRTIYTRPVEEELMKASFTREEAEEYENKLASGFVVEREDNLNIAGADIAASRSVGILHPATDREVEPVTAVAKMDAVITRCDKEISGCNEQITDVEKQIGDLRSELEAAGEDNAPAPQVSEDEGYAEDDMEQDNGRDAGEQIDDERREELHQLEQYRDSLVDHKIRAAASRHEAELRREDILRGAKVRQTAELATVLVIGGQPVITGEIKVTPAMKKRAEAALAEAGMAAARDNAPKQERSAAAKTPEKAVEQRKGGHVYVTYYGSKDVPADAVKVQISTSHPEGMTMDHNITALSPDFRTMVKPHKDGEIDDAEYTRRYNAAVLGPKKDAILGEVSKIREKAAEEGRDVYLYCYCAPGKFCHRYLVNNFLNENGIACQENPADRRKYVKGHVELFGEGESQQRPSQQHKRAKASQEDIVADYNNGTYIVRVGEQKAYADKDLNIVSKCYKEIAPATASLSVVTDTEGLCNLIFPDGREVLPVMAQRFFNASEGMMPVKTELGFNFVNLRTGQMLDNNWYDHVSGFSNGFSVVRKDGKYNYLGGDGRLLCGNWLETAEKFSPDGTAKVTLRGNELLLDTAGTIVKNLTQALGEARSNGVGGMKFNG